eukprot:4918424-Amphidinium_carterae.1
MAESLGTRTQEEGLDQRRGQSSLHAPQRGGGGQWSSPRRRLLGASLPGGHRQDGQFAGSGVRGQDDR